MLHPPQRVDEKHQQNINEQCYNRNKTRLLVSRHHEQQYENESVQGRIFPASIASVPRLAPTVRTFSTCTGAGREPVRRTRERTCDSKERSLIIGRPHFNTGNTTTNLGPNHRCRSNFFIENNRKRFPTFSPVRSSKILPPLGLNSMET